MLGYFDRIRATGKKSGGVIRILRNLADTSARGIALHPTVLRYNVEIVGSKNSEALSGNWGLFYFVIDRRRQNEVVLRCRQF